MTVGVERTVGHRRAEVGAADADVHHVGDAIVGPHAVGERSHLIEHLVHVRHDVDSVDRHHRALRGTERNVHHGAVLGDVDVLAGEHRIAARFDPRRFGQLDQRRQDTIVDAVLRVVDAQVGHVDHVALGASRVVGEQLAEVGGRGEFGQSREGVGGVHRLRTYRADGSGSSAAAAGSSITQVSVRRTRATGNESSPRTHRCTIDALVVPETSISRARAALTTNGVSVMRAKPLNSPIATHCQVAVDDTVTGWPRRCVTVVAEAQVHDVEVVGQPSGVASCAGDQIVVGHRHQLDAARQVDRAVRRCGPGARRGQHARRPARSSRRPRARRGPAPRRTSAVPNSHR